jgi:hypothetical protein
MHLPDHLIPATYARFPLNAGPDGSPGRRHRRASQEDVRLHARLHHWRPHGLGKDTPDDEAGQFEDSDPCVGATFLSACPDGVEASS